MNHGSFNCNVALKSVLLICSTLSTSVSYAEYFGSPTGRTANFSTQPQLTLEATFSNGEFISADYQQLGLRLNYQYTPKILVFGDLGQSELNSESETSFGLGAFYSLEQSILGSANSAVKVSLHQVNFERIAGITTSSGGGTTISQDCKEDKPITLVGKIEDDLSPGVIICVPVVNTTSGTSSTSAASGGDIRNIAIELLISGGIADSILGDSASWYANSGIQMLDGEYEDDTILGFGAGIVLPVSESEVYAGFDYADETYIGFGYRYFVK